MISGVSREGVDSVLRALWKEIARSRGLLPDEEPEAGEWRP